MLILSIRSKFKNLSLYEKMYTLVKTLYRSLDLKRTCQEILNTVSLLLDADRCSLFLVTDDSDKQRDEWTGSSSTSSAEPAEKCLISVVFDAKSKGSKSKGSSSKTTNDDTTAQANNDETIKIPYGSGIAGYVAATGQSLNISDAYTDSRFNDAIDKLTGYRTKNVLCLPIMNEHDECIAVAEAINKLSDADGNVSCFTKEDEKVCLETFVCVCVCIYRQFS